jgi:membrane protease YdiL (CAAX protease family)
MSMTTIHTTSGSTATKYAFPQILLMHLGPGVTITAVFVLLARLAASRGWPASLALLVTWVVAGIPLLLGILFYQGYKLNGEISLKGILLNRQSLPFRQYAWLIPVLLVWTAVCSTLLYPLAELLQHALFSWWPNWLNLSTFAQNPAQYSKPILWTIVLLSAVLNVAVPITEELYFRSYLMPRLPFGQVWTPLLSTVLFSLYHFWLPWDFLGRIVSLLPVVFLVQRKQNVYLSIFVHCLLNSLGTLGLLAIVIG